MSRGVRFSCLLTLVLCVPSDALSSQAKAAWEVGASGAASGPVAARDSSLDTAEDDERMAAVVNVSSLDALSTVDKLLGTEASSDSADVDLVWAKRAAAPWSLTATRALPQSPPLLDGRLSAGSSKGETLYQLGAESAQTMRAAYVAGVPLLLVVVFCPLSICVCYFLFLDELGGPEEPRKKQQPRSPKQLQQQQLQQQQADPLLAQPQRAGRSPPLPARQIQGSMNSPPGRSVTMAAMASPPGSIPATSMPPSSTVPRAVTTGNMPEFASPPSSIQLLAPVVEKQSGEVFVLKGRVMHTMQDGAKLAVELGYTNEKYAMIFINENQMGGGVLLQLWRNDLQNYENTAYFDTQFAVGRHAETRPLAQRKVTILHTGPQGLDPTADPVATVMPSAEIADEVVVYTGGNSSGVPLLQVKLTPDGQASRIRTPPAQGARNSKVVGMMEPDEGNQQQRLFVYCGIDPVLVLCSVVAAIKIGVHQIA